MRKNIIYRLSKLFMSTDGTDKLDSDNKGEIERQKLILDCEVEYLQMEFKKIEGYNADDDLTRKKLMEQREQMLLDIIKKQSEQMNLGR